MPLPSSWLDHLFAKLTVRYGATFTRQWPDADPELVKADWAEVLDGFSGNALGYALKYLPATPPNAMQFRDLCRAAPAPAVVSLTGPAQDTPDPKRVRAALETLNRARSFRSTSMAQECINNIERIVNGRGGAISTVQKQMVEECLRVANTSTTLPIRAKRMEEATQ